MTLVSPWWSPLLALGLLLGGAAVVAVLHAAVGALVAGGARRGSVLEPFARVAWWMRQRATWTERPDALLWVLAPAVYASMAAVALGVVPLSETHAIADVRTGIVVFGAAEALAIVAIFMHGWSTNSHLGLLGAYRFVALGLSYELLSMFVLIAAALPAESLRVSDIVRSQAELWNVLRQPLGLPLWLVVCLGVTFWGPLNVADGGDLAGGTSLEHSGRDRVVWQVARGAMLSVMAAMGAATFLGGWAGPDAFGLSLGWLWMFLKTLGVLLLVLLLGHGIGRLPIERAVSRLWTVGLPLSFLHLAWAGLEALWW